MNSPSRIVVAAAVIRRGSEVLLARRPPGKPPAGLEVPGGKVEAGETPAAALRRELVEELGVSVLVLDPIWEAVVPEKGLHLLFLRAVLAPGSPKPAPREGQQCRWVKVSELPSCGLLPADRAFAAFLAEAETGQNGQ